MNEDEKQKLEKQMYDKAYASLEKSFEQRKIECWEHSVWAFKKWKKNYVGYINRDYRLCDLFYMNEAPTNKGTVNLSIVKRRSCCGQIEKISTETYDKKSESLDISREKMRKRVKKLSIAALKNHWDAASKSALHQEILKLMKKNVFSLDDLEGISVSNARKRQVLKELEHDKILKRIPLPASIKSKRHAWWEMITNVKETKIKI